MIINGGDDWNDKPYEINAGEPYDDYQDEDGKYYDIDLVEVYFELPNYHSYLPCDGYLNSTYSVEDINKGAIAWIHTDDFNIQAGETYKNFCKIISEHKGKIFILTKFN